MASHKLLSLRALQKYSEFGVVVLLVFARLRAKGASDNCSAAWACCDKGLRGHGREALALWGGKA